MATKIPKIKSYYGAMLDPSQGAFAEMDPAANVDPEGYDPFLKALGLSGKPDPLLAAKRFNVVQAPVAKGSGLTNVGQEKSGTEDTDTNKKLSQLSKKLIMDTPDFTTLLNRTENSDVFKQQKAGVGEMRDILAMASHAPADIFSGPISGLLETEFGRKTGTMNANRGPTPYDQTKNLLGYQDKIQDDQSNYAKNLFEAIGKQQGGTQLDSLMQQLALKATAEQLTKSEAKDPNAYAKKGSGGPDLTKLLKEHQKRMQDLQPLEGAYASLTGAIDKAIPGGLANWDGKSDIPGVGATGHLPSFLLSGKGSEIQRAHQELQNAIIYATSGKQINESEGRRLSLALGAGITGGDREFLQGILNYGKEYKNIMRQREAAVRGLPGVGDQVMKLYKAGGGGLSDDFHPPEWTPPAARGKGKAPAVDFNSMSDAELEAFIKKGGKH